MYKNALRAAWAEINVTNLDFNIRKIREKVGPNRKITGIIKADGYGHGSVKVADVLRANGITSFGVATLSEAVRLRDAGFITDEIIVIGLTPDPYVDTLVEYDLTCVTGSYSNAKAISDAAAKAGKTINGYIVCDTGMGRIGTRRGGIVKMAEFLHQNPHAILDGLYSHLASVENDPEYTERQIGFFRDSLTNLQLRNITVPHIHLAASTALVARPDAHFTLVRPGHSIYGLEKGYEPILSLKTRIVYVKDVPAGFSISYNRSFVATRPIKIATLPLGYGDGYMRALSNKADVLIRGKRCRVLGNITMDMLMVDISAVPDACVGDEVVAVGRQGDEEITLAELAELAGTIDYEICTQLNARVPRIYK